MPRSVLEAVKAGLWDFEPQRVDKSRYAPTQALPGTDEKRMVLERRIELGLPLWHPDDRLYYGADDEGDL